MVCAFFCENFTKKSIYKGLQCLDGEHISGTTQRGDPIGSYYSNKECMVA